MWSQSSKNKGHIVLKEFSEWEKLFQQIIKLNKWELCAKRSSKAEKTKEQLLEYFICHHGFRPNYQNVYTIEDSDIQNSMRKKKTNCPFEICLYNYKKNPLVVTISVHNEHNHPLDNAARTFAKISNDTKNKIYSLFEDKKTPSQARKIHERNMSPLDTIDRSMYPRRNDYYRLYYSWLHGRYGAENGPEMWAKLQEAVSKYEGKCYFSGKASF